MPNPAIRRRAFLGRPTFNELSLPNVVLALLADRMPVVADGTAISSFTDFSVNANHATQGTGANQPLYKIGVQNGRPGILFDGSNDIMVTGALALTSWTIFSIFRMTGTAGVIYEQSVNAGSNSGLWLYGSDGSSIAASRSAGVVQSQKDRATNWAVDNATRLVVVNYEGTHGTHTMRINGTEQTLTNVISQNPGTAEASAAIYVGARSGPALPSNGYIFGLVVCSPSISPSEIDRGERGLKRKWGIE